MEEVADVVDVAAPLRRDVFFFRAVGVRQRV
jgi:hypothetical protein